MSWSALLVVLLPLVGQYFGPLVKKLIENLLPKTGQVPATVTAAPAGLAEFLKDLIVKQVESRLAFNPLLKGIALAFVGQLDTVINLLWDQLFSKNLVTVRNPAFDVPAPVAIDCPVGTREALEAEFGG